MAKKQPSWKKMDNYLRGTVDEEVALTTLAPKVLVSAIFDETVEGRTLISSMEAIYSLSNYTALAGAGPVLVLIAHSDYTDAQIEEFIETTGSWSRGDLVQTKEIAKRRIRRIGIFENPPLVTDVAVLNDGKPIKKKLNWQLEEGQTLRLCGYNLGGVAFATTAPSLKAEGHANLWSL